MTTPANGNDNIEQLEDEIRRVAGDVNAASLRVGDAEARIVQVEELGAMDESALDNAFNATEALSRNVSTIKVDAEWISELEREVAELQHRDERRGVPSPILEVAQQTDVQQMLNAASAGSGHNLASGLHSWRWEPAAQRDGS
jgi:hypothetical protein